MKDDWSSPTVDEDTLEDIQAAIAALKDPELRPDVMCMSRDLWEKIKDKPSMRGYHPALSHDFGE